MTASNPPLNFSRIFEADVTALRFAFLIAAMMVYALAGSPTPDQPGFAEAIVGALLLLAAGGSSIAAAFIPDARAPLWRSAGQFLLLYGLTLPFVNGIMQGNDPRLALRDMIPFLFMMLPLFTADIFQKRPEYYPRLVAVFAVAGLLFSLRGLGEIHAIGVSLPQKAGELYYLANAPSVLFAALWIAGIAGHNFVRQPDTRRLIILGAAAALALMPVLAMSWTLQRAGLGTVALYFAVLLALGFWRYPYRIVFLALIALALTLPFLDQIMEVLQVLLRKTALYGSNMRTQEMAAVWREIGDSPTTLLFGEGWGGTFESPAVAGVRVNYTHSLLTATLLKTGAAGLFFLLCYLYGLFRALLSHITKDMVLGLALAAPFLIDVFLYASYKSLDFGLLLLVIAAFS